MDTGERRGATVRLATMAVVAVAVALLLLIFFVTSRELPKTGPGPMKPGGERGQTGKEMAAKKPEPPGSVEGVVFDEAEKPVAGVKATTERVQAFYEQKGLLATEHAVLDDNGDGIGSREFDERTGDGELASKTYLELVLGG